MKEELPLSPESELAIEGDSLGVLLKDRILYHGSSNPATETFLTSEEADDQGLMDGATVGTGLYLTSEKTPAAGYARRRADRFNKEGVAATVYETKVDDLKLLNLRTQENITAFAEKFRAFLVEKLKNGGYKDSSAWVNNAVIQAIEEIGRGITLQNIQKISGYSMATEFRSFIESLGYDGLVTLEGGEGHEDDANTHVGNHDSYVIFNPTKVSILSRETI